MNIAQITTKNKTTIKPSNLVVLVGPNNVGKSQFLKEIHNKIISQKNISPKIIEQIDFVKPPTFNDMIFGLRRTSKASEPNSIILDGITSTLMDGKQERLSTAHETNYEDHSIDAFLPTIGKFKAAYLDAERRLQIGTRRNVTNSETAPANLLQILMRNKTGAKKELECIFEQTFNYKIKLSFEPADICFRVAKKFEGEEPSDISDKIDYFSQYETLNDQGDGFKSFVGVTMSILLCNQRIILLDEPEAFLHSTQSRILGRWIAEKLNPPEGSESTRINEQIFIATHNANFLSGLLSGSDNVDIFRLNRIDDNTSITEVTSEAISELTKSPLLSSQSVHEAIFSEGVVVCEGDADRIFYQKVFLKEHSSENILFVHSHGKHNIKDIINLLKPIQVPISTIVDIDILNSKDDFKNLLSAFIDEIPNDYLEKQKRISEEIYGSSEDDTFEKCKEEVQELLTQLQNDEHNLSGLRSAIERIETGAKKWKIVKETGVDGMPQNVRGDAKTLINDLKTHGIFVVEEGELESWIKLGLTKNKWIVPALTEINNGKCPEKLKNFTKKIIDYL